LSEGETIYYVFLVVFLLTENPGMCWRGRQSSCSNFARI